MGGGGGGSSMQFRTPTLHAGGYGRENHNLVGFSGAFFNSLFHSERFEYTQAQGVKMPFYHSPQMEENGFTIAVFWGIQRGWGWGSGRPCKSPSC